MSGVFYLEPGAGLGLRRGEVAVFIPVYGGPELFSQCLDSVLHHTDPGVPILIADDASPDPEIRAIVDAVAERPDLAHTVLYVRQAANGGFPRNCNTGFNMAAPADVVILNSDVRVAAGWLDGLRAAAYCDSIVASATPLTNNGTIVSIPDRNHPRGTLPDGWEVDSAAAAIAAGSLRLRPRIPTAIGHCVWLRRSALDLVGGFDEAFSPGYGEEVDWSQRCVLRGLCHVVADDVFVFHHGASTFGVSDAMRAVKERHDRMNQKAFPYYLEWVQAEADSETSQLARAIDAARRALGGISVTIDGSSLGPVMTGTQVLTLETILALKRHGGVELTVAVPRNLGNLARAALERAQVATFVWEDEREPPAADIAHRTAQVGRRGELSRLKQLGRHTLVSQLDFIAYRNPGYFDTYSEWQAYRRTARETLARADQVLFISEHSREEALAEGLVDQDRAHVVYPGIDHGLAELAGEPRPPSGLENLEPGFLLCFGTDFRHKNRLFALDLVHELRTAHGWRGHLLLVGATATPGSSGAEEDRWLGAHTESRPAVVRLGHVPELERRWLLANAGLVVAPSVYEGFGLVPFEAAAAGVPTLFAAQASLAEVLPAATARLVPWDVHLAAGEALRLLGDAAAARELVGAVQEAGARFTWDRSAEQLIAIYRRAVALPAVDGWFQERSEVDELLAEDGAEDSLFLRIKVMRYWTQFGLWEGSRLGFTALVNRIRRRLRRRQG